MVLAHGSYGIKTMAANVKPLKNGSLVPVLLPQTPGFGHFNPAKQLADRMYALYLNLTLYLTLTLTLTLTTPGLQ